jgi:hypothetical protein
MGIMETEQIIKEATEIIDKALKEISGRDLVSSSQMSDLLLDMRQLMQSSSK